MRRVRLLSTGVLAALCFASTPDPGSAQRIPEYIRYLPLEVPRAFRESPASARFQLYPRPEDAGFRDESPRDGLDDARAAVLTTLAERFSPILIQNTYSVPMEHQRFLRPDGSQPLFIDTWNMGVPGGELARRDSLDLQAAAARPCPGEADASSRNDDCRLLQLLKDYDPDDPASAVERSRAIEQGSDPFRVLYLDFPGEDAESWKREFSQKDGSLKPEYRTHLSIYAHPFITEVEGGFEFVLQYWFFYSLNDGGNNHLGDWEHVNVLIARRENVERPWTAEELEALLRGEELEATGSRQLVLRKIDYYFHSKVLTMDFTRPNVYAPHDEWKQERDRLARAGEASEWMLDRIRDRAYQDRSHTEINTHPIGYIGADNKGTDQLLNPPRATNRDSHGTYPFPGLFRDIGPAAAAEEIQHDFDHAAYFSAPEAERTAQERSFKGGGVLRFSGPTLRLLPDFEAVQAQVYDDPEVRRLWYWLFLPVRYGYPAVESPFAGVVAHAETGNLAVLGPNFNGGWNAIGVNRGFSGYDPSVLSGIFPTAWQDNFHNDLGFLNLTYPTLLMLPPFDLLWNVGAAPIRLVTEENHPTFFPSGKIPSRFVGVSSGAAFHFVPDDFEALIYNREQFQSFYINLLLFLLVNGADSTTTATGSRSITETAVSPYYEIDFYVGSRFVSMNTLRHSRSLLGEELSFNNIPPLRLEAELNFWEYSGTLRYNFGTDGFLPYGKLGYGLSWYRLENVSVGGLPVDPAESQWVRQPTFSDLTSFLPNTWHGGAGVEWFLLRQPSPRFWKGIDVTLRADWTVYTNRLGLKFDDIPFEDLIGVGLSASELPRDIRVWRHMVTVGATLSF